MPIIGIDSRSVHAARAATRACFAERSSRCAVEPSIRQSHLTVKAPMTQRAKGSLTRKENWHILHPIERETIECAILESCSGVAQRAASSRTERSLAAAEVATTFHIRSEALMLGILEKERAR